MPTPLTTIGMLRGNVLDVDHYREGTGLSPGWVEIGITLETRSADHLSEISAALKDQGVEMTQTGAASGSPG